MKIDLEKIKRLPPDVKKEFMKTYLQFNEKKKEAGIKGDFMKFVKHVWPEFIEGDHHKIVAEKFNQLAEGKLKRLIINMPPRHTKSEFASFLLPAWMVGRNPKLKIIQSTNTTELSVRFGRKAKQLLDSPEYQSIFKTRLREDSQAAGKWETQQGGEYYAAGVGSAITGRGADLLIIDDPHTEQDAMNKDAMERTFEWYTSGPRQRLQPGGSYPKEDVDTLRVFKKKYGDPCDVVAKDKCFYFAHQEDVDDEGESKETKSHFDFGLYGNHNGNEYSSEDSDHFAHAYFREELKEKGCNPDIIAQQSGKDSNPHKTKHVDMCNKALGKNGNGTYQNDDSIGMAKDFNAPFYADVIGTSYCRSRAIACTKDEYNIFLAWRSAKAKVVSTHQTWINSIMKQCDQLKIGLKAYRYLSEGIELATELGIKVDEAELIRTNSTGLTIYNPSNLANMIKGMKNKNQTREDKIKARMNYEAQIATKY